MSRYDVADDPLCNPGTAVLRNKAGLTDQDELDQFEQLMVLSRAEEPLPEGEPIESGRQDSSATKSQVSYSRKCRFP